MGNPVAGRPAVHTASVPARSTKPLRLPVEGTCGWQFSPSLAGTTTRCHATVGNLGDKWRASLMVVSAGMFPPDRTPGRRDVGNRAAGGPTRKSGGLGGRSAAPANLAAVPVARLPAASLQAEPRYRTVSNDRRWRAAAVARAEIAPRAEPSKGSAGRISHLLSPLRPWPEVVLPLPSPGVLRTTCRIG